MKELDEQRIVDGYLIERKSLRDLAAEHGVSIQPIRRVLAARGIQSRSRGRGPDRQSRPPRKQQRSAKHFSASERTEIKRRFLDEGETQVSLAKRFQCGASTIARVLRLEGVPAGAHGQLREHHHAWKGGKRLNDNGYVMIRVAPDDEIGQAMRPQNGYLLESRLVMAHHLGRPLFADEFVHHGPRGKKDNTLDNLELWTTHHPKGQRADELLEWAREIVARYEDIEDKL